MSEIKVKELADKLTDLVIDEKPSTSMAALIVTLGSIIAIQLEASKDRKAARKEVLDLFNNQMNMILDVAENDEESRPN